jgi:hypothetical protein
MLAVCFAFLSLGLPSLSPFTVRAEAPPAGAGDDADDSAEAGDAETKSAKQQFSDALDELELKLTELERRGRYGDGAVERWVRELEDEYRSNARRIGDREVATEAASTTRRALVRRQQHIALLLWQLRRVGGQLAEADEAGRKISQQIHQLLTKHREAMRDAQLMRRFSELSRRASELRRQHMASRMTHNFHFVHPELKDAPAAGERATGPATEPNEEPSAGMPTGPIQKLAGPIGDLLQLRWHDGGLAWDEQHWNEPFAGHTLRSIDEEVTEELQRRGVTFPEPDNMAGFRKKRLFETPPVVLLFQNFQHVASAGDRASRSFSSGGATAKCRFSVKGIESELLVDADRIQFSVREEISPGRTLRVERDPDGTLRIRLIGDHVMLLEQAADGAVRWIDIGSMQQGDEVTALRGESFAELYRRHPDRVENELFPRLRHCGIGTPMPRFHPSFVDRAVVRLRGVDGETRARFEQLIRQIDGGSFSERQTASRELADNMDRYSLLLNELDRGSGLSAEVSTRLADLDRQYENAFETIDTVFDRAAWLDDPRYLAGLLERVASADAAAVVERLQSLTGQSFGNDAARWRDWLASQR